jgi:hypothetical protein
MSLIEAVPLIISASKTAGIDGLIVVSTIGTRYGGEALKALSQAVNDPNTYVDIIEGNWAGVLSNFIPLDKAVEAGKFIQDTPLIKGTLEKITDLKLQERSVSIPRQKLAEIANETDLGVDLTRGWFIEPKLQSQMRTRGWTQSDINNVLDKPVKILQTRDMRHNPLINGKNNQPATVYYATDGHYVVRNDITGEIIQVSKRGDNNWIDPFGKLIQPTNQK